ncbi:MAG: phosphoglucosamine mutase [Candidatus Babeliales bacterium]
MIPSLFGTDGIRGTVGTHPFTRETLPALGSALAQWALETYGTHPRIMIASDTRQSCAFIKAALASGLLQHSVKLYDTQILPTPALCYITQKMGIVDCGIMISASHNLYSDNGIKIIDARRGKLSAYDEQRITDLYTTHQFPEHPYHALGSHEYLFDAATHYSSALSALCTPQFLHGNTIVIDCANGALSTLAPSVFEYFGAQVITLNNTPNGTNINEDCGALHPRSTQAAVARYNADVGFAFDGDGDRVIAISKNGEIKDGDDMLALLLDHPRYCTTPTVVGTDMTNQGFLSFLKQRNISLIRTKVGDKYIAQCLEQQQLILGGEQSGHIIMRDYLDTGDGLCTALRVLEAMSITNNWDMNTFTKFPQLLINIPVAVKKDLSAPAIASIIEQGNAQLKSGRLVVRYSGTENVLRIMIEDDELSYVQQLGNYVADALKQVLS